MPKYNFVSSRRLMTAAVFGVLIVGTPVIDTVTTKNAIYPNVSVASIKLGGHTNKEAQALLENQFSAFLSNEIEVQMGMLRVSLPLDKVIALYPATALTQAMSVGTSGSLLNTIKERAIARTRGIDIPAPAAINDEALGEALHALFFASETPPKEASFQITFENATPRIAIEPESAGFVVDIATARTELETRAKMLKNSPISLTKISSQATLTASDLESLRGSVEVLLGRAPIKVHANDKEWIIEAEEIAQWIKVVRQEEDVVVTLDQDKIITWLDTSAKGLERSASDAIFELAPEGNKVTRFSPGISGLFVPREENAAQIAQTILDTTETSIDLITKVTPPRITQNGSELYGIKELVGTGTTNFKGSPPNRIKNIKRGAALLNGILIAPGEEFSVLDRLRPFTLENGYLPELVIKAAEGKTTPEIGGGLCQIGTTMFRAVLNAGLPVTERRNHSYRVSYYEPPVGMDATIYDPAPDFKFINDTGNWLLLITGITGTNLTFELWGTKDGRTAISSIPEVYNFKQPPAKKIIETLDLPPGKIKCTEKAHIGSDARFIYTVTYTDGRIVEKEFFSRYRPWQEVCLLGVEALTPVSTEVLPESPETPSDTFPN